MTNDSIELYIDGGSRGNPGIAGCGWFFQYQSKKFTGHKNIGFNTNNQAEYRALFYALDDIKIKLGHVKNLKIYTDSKLLAEQINGNWKVKDKNIAIVYSEVTAKLKEFDWFIKHIPRELNKIADREANLAMDEIN